MKRLITYRMKDNQVEIKDGFSWPAFFFGWLWGWHHHLGAWHNLKMFLVASLSGIFWPLSIIVCIYFGYKGNIWLAESLERRGYTRV